MEIDYDSVWELAYSNVQSHLIDEGRESLKENILKAQEFLTDIKAGHSKSLERILIPPLRWLFASLYPKIEADGVGPVREQRDAVRIYTPTHRSIIDPFILGLGLIDEGEDYPHFAAGRNLYNPLTSWFLRRLKAIATKRNFRDRRYHLCLKEYAKSVLIHGGELCFFPEGGRPRNGGLGRMRLGLLGAAVGAAIEADARYVMFPTGIAYNHIMEERQLAREAKTLTGWRALRELIAHTAKNMGKGEVAINFAEPIDLTSFVEGKTKQDIPDLREELASKVRAELAKSFPVFPTALMSYSLIKSPDIGGGYSRFLLDMGVLLGRKDYRPPMVGGFERRPKEVFDQSIDDFVSRGIIRIEDSNLSILEMDVMKVYSNTICHHFDEVPI